MSEILPLRIVPILTVLKRVFLIKPFLAFMLSAFCAGAAGADTISWAGNSEDWNDPLNWSGGSVPGYSDDVTIPDNLSHNPKITSGTAVCKTLTIDPGGISPTGGTLTVTGGALWVYDGALTVGGALTVTGGALQVNGNLTVNNGGTLDMSPSPSSTITFNRSSGTITNNNASSSSLKLGEVRIGGDYTLNGAGAEILADFAVYNGSTFTAAAASTITLGGSGTITNANNASPSSLKLGNVIIAGSYTLNGAGAEIAGNFTVNNGGTFTASTSEIKFTGTSKAIKNDAALTSLVFGTVIVAGSYNNVQGNMQIAGDFTVNSGGTFNALTSVIQFTGSNKTIKGRMVIDEMRISGSSLTLDSTADIEIKSNLKVTGTFTADAASKVTIDGSGGIINAGADTNRFGKLSITGSGSYSYQIQSNISTLGDFTMMLYSSGTLTFVDSGDQTIVCAGACSLTSGTITKTSGNLTITTDTLNGPSAAANITINVVGTFTIQPRTVSQDIGINISGGLNINEYFLDRITAQEVIIGHAQGTGVITMNYRMAATANYNLTLRSPNGTLFFQWGFTMTNPKNLTLDIEEGTISGSGGSAQTFDIENVASLTIKAKNLGSVGSQGQFITNISNLDAATKITGNCYWENKQALTIPSGVTLNGENIDIKTSAGDLTLAAAIDNSNTKMVKLTAENGAITAGGMIWPGGSNASVELKAKTNIEIKNQIIVSGPSGKIEFSAEGAITQSGGNLVGKKGIFSAKSIVLERTANALEEVGLTSLSGASTDVIKYTNAGSFTIPQLIKLEYAALTLRAESGDITLADIDGDDTAKVDITAPNGKIIVKKDIGLFNAPVIFHSPVEIDGNVTIGVDECTFEKNVTGTANSSLSVGGKTKLVDDTVIQCDTIMFTGIEHTAQSKSLTVEAAELTLKNENITTKDGDIIFKVDKLTMTGTPGINAGSGIFQISPSSPDKTIAYADNPGPPLTADVKYSSEWSSVSAASFIVGSNNQSGTITIGDVGNPSNYRPSVKFQTKRNTPPAAAVIFTGGFYGNDLEVETDTVLFSGVSAITANKIDFKDSAITDKDGGTNYNADVTLIHNDLLTLNKVDVKSFTEKSGTSPVSGLSVTVKGAITTTGNISFENNITAAASVEFKTTGGTITLGGNVDAGTNDITFETTDVNKKIIVKGAATAVPRTIKGKIITFKGTLTDDESGSGAGTNLTIEYADKLYLGNVNVCSLTCGASGAAGTVYAGADIIVRSTSSLVFNTDLILTNTLTINDTGTTTFEKNIYSDANGYHGLNIETNILKLKGNIGDTTERRLGALTIKAGEVTARTDGQPTSLYTAGDIELQKNSAELKLSGSFAFDAQDIRSPLAVIKKINAQTTAHNGNLTVNAGIFDIGNYNYQLGGAFKNTAGFLCESGTLTLNNKARFITQGDFTMTGGALTAHPLSVIEMSGSGSANITLNSPAAQRIGSFEIIKTISPDEVTAQSDLVILGDWTQPSDGVYFNPNGKTVTFTGETNGGIVTIIGNTRWYNFKAEGSSLNEIKFSNYDSNNTHTFLNNISVKGTAAKRVKLTSITENPNPYTPQTIPTVPNLNFWVIDARNTYTFEYVDVYHSFASPNIISVSPVLVNTGKLSPYWTLNWNSDFYYLFAFTEDSTGSGAPDRLRIQPSVNELNSTSHDFSNFKIEVDGYDVIGYSTDGVLNTKSFPSRFIYAHLRPRSDLRPEQRDTPVWRLINAGSIIDNNTKISIGTFPSFTLKAVDTVAPRLLYSLSNPDTGELYLKFSKQTDAMPLSFTVSVPSGSKSFTRSRSVDTGWLYNGSTPVSAKDLISDPRFNDQTIFTGVTSVAPASWPAYPSGLDLVNPYYPKDFSYNIAEVAAVDIFTNPNPASLSAFVPDLAGANGGMKYQSLKGWEGSRRLSDLLPLAQPPALSANSSFWPSFAVNTGVSEGAPNTLINQWDGSKSLFITNDVNTRALSALIELHAADKIPFSLPPPLLLAVDVSREFRQDKTAGNLWLPSIKPSSANAVDIALSFVPSVFSSAQSLSGNVVKLEYVYAITANNIGNKGSIDFIFSVPALQTPLYAVRLDYRARNWYEGLKPFSFSVQELTRQRGGVTIASNVVNPEKNTTTKISYVLTRSGPVTINVFTLDGTIVKTLYRGRRDKGEFFVEWDGRNNAGRAVARGLYFVRVVGPDIDEMRKVMVVK